MASRPTLSVALAGLMLAGIAIEADAGQPAQQRFFANPRFPNRIASFVLKDRFLVGWCRRDAQSFCPEISGGIAAHSACVMSHYEELSLGCQTAIDMVQNARSRRVASGAPSH